MNTQFLLIPKGASVPLFVSLFLCFCLIPFIKIPIFFADYWFSKWVVVYGATIVFAFYVYASKKIIFLPQFNHATFIGLGLIFIITIFNHIYYKASFLTPSFWDRLCFVLLSLSFFNFFRGNPSFIKNLLITLFVANTFFILSCIPTFYEFFCFELKNPNILQKNFGNINMSAEFVGISLVLLISGRGYFKHSRFLIDILICLSIIYCYYASSRSIVVAVGFSFFVLICLKIIHLKRIILYIIICGIFLFSIELLIKHFSTDFKNLSLYFTTHYDKPSSTNVRWQIIMGTLEMIRDHPFGVGPGNYIFSFIPYMHRAMPGLNEMNIAQSPHNEYLRIIAEDGIPFVLVLLITFSFYLYSNKDKLKLIASNHPTIIGFFSFLIIQAAFQFPLINAFPFMITACFVGYIFSIFHADHAISLSRKGWGLSALFVSLFFLIGIISEAISFLYPFSSHLNKISYQLNRSNWQAAVQAARIDMKEGNFISAQQMIDRELEIHPDNFIALSVKAELEGYTGNSYNYCILLKKIDGYFKEQSIFHTYLLQNCPPILESKWSK